VSAWLERLHALLPATHAGADSSDRSDSAPNGPNKPIGTGTSVRNVLRPGRFVLRNDGSGLCAAEPCILPFISPVRKLEDGLSKRQRKALARSVRLLACADIIIAMAGPIAEHIHLSSLADAKEWDEPYEDATDWRWQEKDRAFAAEGGEEGTDSWQVEQRIEMLGRRWRLHLDRAFGLADRIVRNHQPHIHALASALVERGMIDGDEIEEMFDGIRRPQ
jgi:hypothetical protein